MRLVLFSQVWRLSRARRAQALAWGLLLAPPALCAGAADRVHMELACQNFYQAANHAWLADPAIEPGANIFSALAQRSRQRLTAALERFAAAPLATVEYPNLARLHTLLLSVSDRAKIEQLGLNPLAAELRVIDSLSHKDQLPAILAQLQRAGVRAPIWLHFESDMSTEKIRVQLDYTPGGGGDEATLRADAQQIFRLIGSAPDAVNASNAVVRMTRARLAGTASPVAGFDFAAFQRHLGIALEHQSTPDSYLQQQMTALVEHFTLSDWKAYLRWALIQAYRPHLPQTFMPARAAHDPSRVALENLPDAVQQLYLQQVISSQARQRARAIATQVRQAMARRLATRSWLSSEGKARATHKLNTMKILLGRPENWIDYRGLNLEPDQLIANLQHVAGFELTRKIGLLGTVQEQGHMSGADWARPPGNHFSPGRNAVVISPLTLESEMLSTPPNPASDYGSLGTLIAHEVLHGFDHPDQQGAEPEWPARAAWLPASDVGHYHRMVERELTQRAALERRAFSRELERPYWMAEEIADLGMVPLALSALNRVAPVNQQGHADFFAAFARTRREKLGADQALNAYRINAPLMNLRRFATTYGCNADSPMVREPGQRVKLW